MAENDDYTEGEGTPSQQALDSQLQQGNVVAAANYQGRIALAKTQVMEAVQEGSDSAAGRELLGDLDNLAEFPDAGDHAEVYSRFKTFIKSGAAPVAPPGQGAAPESPAPAPSAPKINKQKALKDYVDGKISTSKARELGIV